MKTNSNRRHIGRLRIDRSVGLSVQIFPVMPFLGEAIQVSLVNLSSGGMAFSIRDGKDQKALKNGKNVKVHFRLPGLSLEECQGIVSHSYITQQGHHVIGIRFVKASAALTKELEQMSVDNDACDRRIRETQNAWCVPNCSYYALCRKPVRQEDENVPLSEPWEISLQSID